MRYKSVLRHMRCKCLVLPCAWQELRYAQSVAKVALRTVCSARFVAFVAFCVLCCGVCLKQVLLRVVRSAHCDAQGALPGLDYV